MKSKAELLALLGQICAAAPEMLSYCGVEGFEADEDEEDDEGY